LLLDSSPTVWRLAGSCKTEFWQEQKSKKNEPSPA
jgi:hypothetical protein